MSDRTALYRHWCDGELLYVGISGNPFVRTHTHAYSSEWAELIDTITIEWFDTRANALAAEANAIQTEAPAFNRDAGARAAGFVDDPVRPAGGSRMRALAWTDMQTVVYGKRVALHDPPRKLMSEQNLHLWKAPGETRWLVYVECMEAFRDSVPCPHGLSRKDPDLSPRNPYSLTHEERLAYKAA